VTAQKQPRYSLTPEQQMTYAGVLVLEQMVNHGVRYPLVLEIDHASLGPIFDHLLNGGYVQISGKDYTPTAKGADVVKGFKQRENEYLAVFDLYCAVDLKAGEFAFARYFDDDQDGWIEYMGKERWVEIVQQARSGLGGATPEWGDIQPIVWQAFLNEDRWDDMRVAVAEFKGMNPIDIVFMSLLSAGRFDSSSPDWAETLSTGDTWKEMLDVCNTNVHADEVGFDETDESGKTVTYSSEDVMKEIINQGSTLMFDLLKKQTEADQSQSQALAAQAQDESMAAGDTVTETTTTTIVEETPSYYVNTVAYYDPWWDPFYFSPIWAVPFLIW
jgi:hypothetical protein